MKNNWEKVVKNCGTLLSSIKKHFESAVEQRLRLGRYLLEVVINSNSGYGNHVIEKLASDLSNHLGYRVYPQRLYEYMKIAQKFKSIDEIYKEAGTKNITWADIMKLCRIKKSGRIFILITLTEKDKDILKYKVLPFGKRNDFLKESLRLGIRTLDKVKKMPEMERIQPILTFKTAKGGGHVNHESREI